MCLKQVLIHLASVSYVIVLVWYTTKNQSDNLLLRNKSCDTLLFSISY